MYRFAILCCIFFLSFISVNAQEFIKADDYIKIHLHQKELTKKFYDIVQGDAVPIKNDHKKVKIAIIYPGKQLSDYWIRSKKSFELRMKELNIKYELSSEFIEENDIENIKNKIYKIVQENYDYLIFTLDINQHKKILDSILKRKTPKLIIQNITTPLKDWEGNQPFLYVGFDHIEGAKLLSEYFIKKYPQNSKFMMLYFTDGYVSKMRGDSFINFVSEKHRLIASNITDGKKDKAKQFVSTFKKINKIDYIYSCSTDISIGAYEALSQLGIKNKIGLNGWGGGEKELEMILNKQLDVTVMRMNDDNGVAMAEAIKLDIIGEDVPTIFSGKLVLVDKDMHESQIKKLKERAFRYSK